MSPASDPPVLTPELLEGLLESLTKAGFPTVQRLRPGLTVDQMDEITAPLGLVLPAEARVWWSRHNGGLDEAPIGSSHALARLEEMVGQAQLLRRLHREGYEEAGVVTWDDRLLPLVHSETMFGCDCSVREGEPSPISVWIPKDAEDLREPVLPSLGSLVEIWTVAIDEGLYEYLPDKGHAVSHLDRLQPGRWPYGLP